MAGEERIGVAEAHKELAAALLKVPLEWMENRCLGRPQGWKLGRQPRRILVLPPWTHSRYHSLSRPHRKLSNRTQ